MSLAISANDFFVPAVPQRTAKTATQTEKAFGVVATAIVDSPRLRFEPVPRSTDSLSEQRVVEVDHPLDPSNRPRVEDDR